MHTKKHLADYTCCRKGKKNPNPRIKQHIPYTRWPNLVISFPFLALLLRIPRNTITDVRPWSGGSFCFVQCKNDYSSSLEKQYDLTIMKLGWICQSLWRVYKVLNDKVRVKMGLQRIWIFFLQQAQRKSLLLVTIPTNFAWEEVDWRSRTCSGGCAKFSFK